MLVKQQITSTQAAWFFFLLASKTSRWKMGLPKTSRKTHLLKGSFPSRSCLTAFFYSPFELNLMPHQWLLKDRSSYSNRVMLISFNRIKVLRLWFICLEFWPTRIFATLWWMKNEQDNSVLAGVLTFPPRAFRATHSLGIPFSFPFK